MYYSLHSRKVELLILKCLFYSFSSVGKSINRTHSPHIFFLIMFEKTRILNLKNSYFCGKPISNTIVKLILLHICLILSRHKLTSFFSGIIKRWEPMKSCGCGQKQEKMYFLNNNRHLSWRSFRRHLYY